MRRVRRATGRRRLTIGVPFPLALSIVLMAGAADAPPAGAQAPTDDELTVEIAPSVIEVPLGESVEIAVSITNRGATATGALAVHIDITDPAAPGSVDPEDWTPTLTRHTDAIGPGTTRTVTWTLQPISNGDFIVYAIAVTPGTTEVHATASAVDLSVSHQRTLNPEGVLPIALAMPSLVGVLLLAQWRWPAIRRRVDGDRLDP